MPKRKKPSVRSVDSAPAEIRGYGVILAEMRAQNRATIEAVETIRVTVEQRIDRFERATDARFTVLEVAVRQDSADIRSLTAQVGALGPLDQRISVLERRSSP